MLLKSYWIHCAFIIMSGGRVYTVNPVATLVEMVMEDHFHVTNLNILDLNPQAF